jgi:AcrR family transcriptional regulator
MATQVPKTVKATRKIEASPEPNGSYHHGDLRNALIKAALELAAEGHGWDFSLREVARRAGVSHNAPYNHFAHKRELMAAAAVAGHELLRRAIKEPAAKMKDSRKALRAMGLAYLNFGLTNPALYRLMFSGAISGPDWHPESVAECGVATRAIVEEVLLRGARSGVFNLALTRNSELQVMALSMWAAVHGFTTLAIDGLAHVDDVSIQESAKKFAQMITDMVGAKRR